MSTEAIRPSASSTLSLCLLSIALLSAGCGNPKSVKPLWSLTGGTMGTTYAVTIVGGTEAAAEGFQEAIGERLADVNRRMSTYDPESELSRFNATESTDWFEVSIETAAVAQAALDLSRRSNGAYDPTVGPLVNLWGFGPDGRRKQIPSEEEIAVALSAVGYEALDVRVDPPALKKSRPDVYLDLSSIAKGHGVDALYELLVESNVDAFMVEIGGEVRCRGTKPDGSPWRIGVEKADRPLADTGKRELQRVVPLVDQAMATSGDYRNFFEVDGERYSHTIDPTSGRPVSHKLAMVTVVADTCRDADGWATTLLVLGPEAGYDWANERGIAAYFVSRSGEQEFSQATTPEWESLIGSDNPTEDTKP